MYLLQVFLMESHHVYDQTQGSSAGFSFLYQYFYYVSPFLQTEIVKVFCERSHYVRGSEFKKRTKEVGYIYCQIS